MIRVLIVDDEARICKLIIKLIDWDQIGMLIIGTASNGIEALELIERERPDIVITDIRMPGYDGLEMIERAKKVHADLEFIIISGYGEFEYAKKAIEFDVKDYILKPINKGDLLQALQKAGEHVKKRKGQISLEKEYQLILENDANKIREAFTNNLIVINTEKVKEHSLIEVNENYYFNFQAGLFNMVVLKIDKIGKGDPRDCDNLLKEIIDNIKSALQKMTYELEIIHNKSNLYILMNYNKSEKRNIKMFWLRALEGFNQRFCTEKAQVTIAFGEEVNTFTEIRESISSAKLLIEDRIIRGTGRIIEPDERRTDNTEIEDLFYHFSKKFIKAVELLDIDKVKKILLNFKADISTKNIRGTELKKIMLEVENIFILTMKSNNIKIDSIENQQKLKYIMENCSSIDSLFNELLGHISSYIMVFAKDNHNLKQIREAKKYIEENYMKNITLEDIGSHLGFNPSYFSSLFKKETGTSFIEYLSKTRIEKAKDLLRESDLRIQDVCLMVGYNDAKYFTKSFIKHTGLKPNEYRKIFA